MKTKIGVLISGRGSNMMTIVRQCENGSIPAEVALVLSNKESAPGVAWARDRGITCEVLPHGGFRDRADHDRALIERLRRSEVEWVCLAGYMRLLSSVFVESFRNRILNIHPSLLPAFRGLHAQRQALEHGVRVSGCTVHFVDLELDHGPIVVQKAVEVLSSDSEDELGSRILEQEHIAYAEALRRLLNERWRIEGRKIIWAEP